MSTGSTGLLLRGHRVVPGAFAFALAALLAAACSSSDEGGGGPGAGAGAPDATAVGPDGGAPGDGPGASGDGGDAGATAPLDLSAVQDRTWAWFDIPGAVCRDGSPAGFGLNLSSPSKKLMLFLQGGGACFNSQTCAGNPSSVGAKSASGGIFSRSNTENPVADWNHVFVPYCTGDVHAGNNPDGNVAGVGPQKFVGYANMELFLAKLAATFPDTAQILVTGTSAGGFGAAANYGHTLRWFPSIPVNLVNDSGPLMRQPPLARCLQDQWKTMWKLDTTVIAECGASCANQPDFLMAASKHWAATKSTLAQGLISATGDTTIRTFYGFGASECTSFGLVSEANFSAGLTDIRAESAAYANFGTYTYGGTRHTLLGADAFYSTTVGSKTVAAWVKDIVDENTVTNVGP
ncbi:MAG: hypothetical protein KF894_06775 [Labilithrix sp.]|nr:hypothetical protein [Labilithrix sp.]